MWLNILIVVILVILSGTFAGLTLALFGIKLPTLERKMKLGNEQARKVYAIRKRGNLLLCTLLLGNVASYTIMAIFLGGITSGVIASFVAIALIFVFGEIIPQAVFPRYALQISAKLSWLVWVLLIVFYPVAAPIAWVLDKILGKEPPLLWSKQELGEIIKYHEDVGEGIIDKDEERIILGALSFSEIKVADIMIRHEEVFFLDEQTTLSKEVFETIKEKGFSRVPVLSKNRKNIIGILLTKNLIGLSPNHNQTIGDLCNRDRMIIINESKKLDDLLNLMVYQKTHMAIVVDKFKNFQGVATMEDIMEEILNTELEDKKT
jgi:metal transporter CNNM